MRRFNPVLIILLLMLVAFSAVAGEFSGDVTMVSTYMWRGVKQFDGVAMQGTAAYTVGAFTAGLWTSSMAGGIAVETDPYVEAAFSAGDVDLAVGGVIYSYDFFEMPGSVYELYASAGLGAFSGAFYFTPSQENLDDAVYWVDLSAGTTVSGFDLSAGLGLGTYSDWTYTDEAESVMSLLLSAGKSLTDNLSVSWNYTYDLSDDDDLGNVFFMSASYGF